MKRLLPILLILTALSCEERIEWQLDGTITPRLIVEGRLTNRPELNQVRLTLPVLNPNTSPFPISNATVIVVSQAGNHPFHESATEPGLYIPDTDIIGLVGEGYRLYINIAGNQFLSNVVGVYPVSPMKEFRYYELENLPGYYVINARDEDEPSYTEYNIFYENPEIAADTLRHRLFSFSLRSIDVNQFFKPNAEWISFPEDATIIRTKYSLAPDHERYIRALLSETEWKGGWFDVLPGNLHTNMSEGAVGYFGASSVVQDTVFFK